MQYIHLKRIIKLFITFIKQHSFRIKHITEPYGQSRELICLLILLAANGAARLRHGAPSFLY